MSIEQNYSVFLPEAVRNLENPQTDIPRIAKDKIVLDQIESVVQKLPSQHDLFQADSRKLSFIPDKSIHLVVTSPPYWTLKKYRDHNGQLGDVEDYDLFLKELDKVWKHCHRTLVPGGRLICIVGDVCLSRKKTKEDILLFHFMHRFKNIAEK